MTVEHIQHRSRSASLSQALVDTGTKYTWIPTAVLESIGVKREKKDLEFLMADGQTVTRSTGFAILRVGSAFTVDEVVFGEPGDQVLLGACTLKGLNFRVDPRAKKLVAAGPILSA